MNLAPNGKPSNPDYEKVVFVNKYSDTFFDYCKKNIKKIIKTLLSGAYYNFKIYDLNVVLTIDDLVNTNGERTLGEYEDETNTLKIVMFSYFERFLEGIDDFEELSKDEKELIGGGIMNILVTADNEFTRNIQDSIRQIFYHEMIHHYDNIKYGKGYVDSVNKLEETKESIKSKERLRYYVNMQHEVDANFISTLARLIHNHGEGYGEFRTFQEMFLGYFPRWEELSKDNKNKVTKRLYKYFEYIGSNPDIRYADGGLTMKAPKLLAPNGKPSNLTPEQYALVRTPAFKAWFGDWENNPESASKVVDENGAPMVCYHGVISGEDWNTYEYFDNDKPYENPDINPIGIYMSNNLEQASNYGYVKKMFCKIIKPLDLSKTKTHTLKQWLVILKKAGLYVDNIKFDSCFTGDYAKYDSYDSKGEYMTQSQINNVKYLWWELIKINSYWAGDGNLLTEIIKQKFDGIFYPENPDESKGKISECIAFEPNQIKLADGSNTTFYSNNPDIRYSGGGGVGYVSYRDKYNKKYGYEKNESHSLKEISKDTGVSNKGLQKIYNKGIGAFKTNPSSVRPNVKSKEQWAKARVYSAVMGGKAARVDAKELKMNNGGEILLAPNGKPSNLTAIQYRIVRTPAFKAWFGDWERLANATIKDPAIDVITLGNISKDVSKVVDSNGEPLVVFRGMSEQSSKKYVFNYNYYQIKEFGRRNKFGFYFTDNYDVARGYSVDSSRNKIIEKIKNIYNVYENRNDFEADVSKRAIVKEYFIKSNNYLDLRSYDSLSYIDLLKILNVSDKGISEFIEKYFWKKSGRFIQKHEEKFAYSKRVVYDLFITQIEKGVDIEDSIGVYFKNKITKKYNGVVFTENTHKKSDTYVAFESNQIKLADGSNTTFDSNNNDIRFDGGGSVGNIIVTNEYEEFDSEVFNELEDEILYGFVVKDENNRIGLVRVEDDIIELGIGYILGLEVFETNKGYGKKIIKKMFELHPTQHAFGGKATSTSKGFWLNLGAEFDGFDEYSFILSKDKLKYADGGLIAPNGQVSNLTPQQYELVRTKAFKEWFGDWQNDPANASRVVDENGEPLVCYHYSPKEFVIFDKKQHPKIANFVENKYHKHLGYDFSTKKGFFQRKDSFEYKVFLNVRNIFNIKYATEKQFEPLIKILSSIPYYSHYEYRKSDLERDIQELKKGQWDSLELPSIEKYLSKKYDGLIMYERDWENIKVYSEKNIKLADGSNTTFDGSNSDVRFNGGGGVGYVSYRDKYNKKYGYEKNESHSLKEISKDTGVSNKGLQKIYNKGIGAFKTNPSSVRPNVKSKEQWAKARVYSAVMGGKAARVDAKELKMNNGGEILLAPNGKPSNLTAIQYRIVRTPAFKAWFGDWERLANATIKDPAIDVITLGNISKYVSKVIDSNGEPLVVRHFSQRKKRHTIFKEKAKKNEWSVSQTGIYFTSLNAKELNDAYNRTGKGILYEVFLNIKNLLDLGIYDTYDFVSGKPVFWKEHHFEMLDKYVTKGRVGTFEDYTEFEKKTDYTSIQDISQNSKDKILKLGYNGIWGNKPNGIYDVIDELVVFYPKQIKLADGSNTTFDSNNNDIRYKKGGLIAPNGQVSNLTPQQYELVRTKAFKEWFGDWENNPSEASKVVDENGEPLVVYHFSDLEFNIFELKGISKGFFFTENKKDDEFSNISVLELINKGEYPNWIKKLMEQGLSIEEIIEGVYFSRYEKSKSVFLNIKKMYPLSWVGEVSEKNWSVPYFENIYIEKAKERNFNGIEFVRELDNKKIVVAFEPNQIKLADGSNTTFDSNNNDIRYKKGGDLVNEPYISDNFQIGPNGAYEHTEENEIINQYADGVDLKKKLKKPKKPKGDCYYAAAQLVMGNRFKHLFGDNNITYIGTPYLVHAEVRGQGKVANIRFGHAWVEDDENIYDYSNGNQFVMPKEIYYAIGDIDNQNPLKYQKYTFEEARRKMVTTRHYGEWDLEVDC
ncbi:MAG: hypothetical protein EXR20_02370 [Bacteroidetes bacterium]|nr:hypothetical protein [Bacteroidota bacterium]